MLRYALHDVQNIPFTPKTAPMTPTPVARLLDTAGPLRPGEELDAAAVDAWLKQQRPELRGLPRVTQYAGGASN